MCMSHGTWVSIAIIQASNASSSSLQDAGTCEWYRKASFVQNEGKNTPTLKIHITVVNHTKNHNPVTSAPYFKNQIGDRWCTYHTICRHFWYTPWFVVVWMVSWFGCCCIVVVVVVASVYASALMLCWEFSFFYGPYNAIMVSCLLVFLAHLVSKQLVFLRRTVIIVPWFYLRCFPPPNRMTIQSPPGKSARQGIGMLAPLISDGSNMPSWPIPSATQTSHFGQPRSWPILRTSHLGRNELPLGGEGI